MTRELAIRTTLLAILCAACRYDAPVVPGDGGDLPTVGFASGSTLVDELSDVVEIPVALSVAGTATVDFSVTGGSAIAGDDFVLTAGTLTFGGSTSETIDLSILPDSLEEPDETIEITLANPTGATLGQATHTVTISANVLPRVRFATAATSVAEGIPANLVLQLDLAPTAPASVTLALSGTATGNGIDYGLANNTIVTIGIGEMTKQVPLDVTSDALDEDDEDVVADLAAPSGLVIDTANATTTHTILDDDLPPVVQFDAPAVTHPEGTADATQTVSLSAPSGKTITVAYAKSAGAAGAGDLTIGGNGTLTFLPGEMTQDIPITVIDDLIDENDEDAILTLSAPVNVTIGAPDMQLTIVDNDDPPTVSFDLATSDTAVTEGTATATLTVALSGESGLPITVGFVRAGASTAAVNGDFTFGTASPLSIPAGETEATITINIVDDNIGEVDELLIVNLQNPTNATLLAPTQHTLTISDNDCLGAGPFRVCPSAAPSGNLTLSGTLNTTNDTRCVSGLSLPGWTAQGQDDACVIIRQNITVDDLVVTGTRPLVLFATGAISVDGTLDASATTTTTNGNAGPSGACTAAATTPVSTSTGGGGGAGASFMSKGGDGGDGNNGGNAGGNAANADAADPVTLRAGCRGQDGGDGSGAGSNGVGGAAGGAVYLVANAIDIGGAIDVSGGGGSGGFGSGANDSGGGGGGGSGGMILLDAATLTFTGTLIANGGGAGQGATNNANGGPGQDPSLGAPTTAAPGGATAGRGGNGGNGMVTGTQATGGDNGEANEGAGGGGGGGGYIRSSGSLAGGTASAGKIVAP